MTHVELLHRAPRCLQKSTAVGNERSPRGQDLSTFRRKLWTASGSDQLSFLLSVSTSPKRAIKSVRTLEDSALDKVEGRRDHKSAAPVAIAGDVGPLLNEE